jgi:hypothetical protein
LEAVRVGRVAGEFDAELISALVLGSAASASVHIVRAEKARQRRESRAATRRRLTRPIAAFLSGRHLTLRGFFSNLVSAVVAWFIGCCVASFLLFAANGFSSLEQAWWAKPVLGTIYVVLAITILYFTFTESD